MTRRIRLSLEERQALLDRQRNMHIEEQLLEEANALHIAICVQEGANPGAGKPFQINTERGLALARARARIVAALEALEHKRVVETCGTAETPNEPRRGATVVPFELRRAQLKS